MNENRLKKVYSITHLGREELKEWLMKPIQKEGIRFEILLKLFFGSQIPTQANIHNIKEFINRTEKTLQLYNQFSYGLHEVLDQSKDHTYILLCLVFGQYISEAYLKWGKYAINALEDLKKSN